MEEKIYNKMSKVKTIIESEINNFEDFKDKKEILLLYIEGIMQELQLSNKFFINSSLKKVEDIIGQSPKVDKNTVIPISKTDIRIPLNLDKEKQSPNSDTLKSIIPNSTKIEKNKSNISNYKSGLNFNYDDDIKNISDTINTNIVNNITKANDANKNIDNNLVYNNLNVSPYHEAVNNNKFEEELMNKNGVDLVSNQILNENKNTNIKEEFKDEVIKSNEHSIIRKEDLDADDSGEEKINQNSFINNNKEVNQYNEGVNKIENNLTLNNSNNAAISNGEKNINQNEISNNIELEFNNNNNQNLNNYTNNYANQRENAPLPLYNDNNNYNELMFNPNINKINDKEDEYSYLQKIYKANQVNFSPKEQNCYLVNSQPNKLNENASTPDNNYKSDNSNNKYSFKKNIEEYENSQSKRAYENNRLNRENSNNIFVDRTPKIQNQQITLQNIENPMNYDLNYNSLRGIEINNNITPDEQFTRTLPLNFRKTEELNQNDENIYQHKFLNSYMSPVSAIRKEFIKPPNYNAFQSESSNYNYTKHDSIEVPNNNYKKLVKEELNNNNLNNNFNKPYLCDSNHLKNRQKATRVADLLMKLNSSNMINDIIVQLFSEDVFNELTSVNVSNELIENVEKAIQEIEHLEMEDNLNNGNMMENTSKSLTINKEINENFNINSNLNNINNQGINKEMFLYNNNIINNRNTNYVNNYANEGRNEYNITQQDQNETILSYLKNSTVQNSNINSVRDGNIISPSMNIAELQDAFINSSNNSSNNLQSRKYNSNTSSKKKMNKVNYNNLNKKKLTQIKNEIMLKYPKTTKGLMNNKNNLISDYNFEKSLRKNFTSSKNKNEKPFVNYTSSTSGYFDSGLQNGGESKVLIKNSANKSRSKSFKDKSGLQGNKYEMYNNYVYNKNAY